MGQILKNFAIGYVIGMVVLVVLTLIVEHVFDSDFEFSGSSVVMLILASASAGGRYAKTHGDVPPPGLSWTVAFYSIPIPWIASGLATAVYVLLDAAVLTALLELLNQMPVILAGVAMFLIVLHVLLVRWSFPFFAKTTLKGIERRKNA